MHKSINYKLIGSTLVCLIIITALACLSFYMAADKSALTLNLSSLIFGVAIGWLAGVLISPYDVGESHQFSKYAKTISVFVSGYLISKVDKLLEQLLSPDFIFQPIRAFRGLMFITSLVVVMLITFVYRRYAE